MQLLKSTLAIVALTFAGIAQSAIIDVYNEDIVTELPEGDVLRFNGTVGGPNPTDGFTFGLKTDLSYTTTVSVSEGALGENEYLVFIRSSQPYGEGTDFGAFILMDGETGSSTIGGGSGNNIIYQTVYLTSETTTLTMGDFSPPAEVPLPAAVWLFGSALLGLGVVKRRKA